MLLLHFVLVISTTAAAAAITNTTKCPTRNGVGIIVARASTEKPGTGVIGDVAEKVLRQVPGSIISAVDYPATLDDYLNSEAYGTGNMTILVRDFVKTCPGRKMVIMGYSQGAQVAGDTVCGTSETGFKQTPAQSASITEAVAAVVLMGDPSHNASAPWNRGTSAKDGVFPRQNMSACDPVAHNMVSYCDADDVYCDSGNSHEVHQSYVRVYGTAAVDFVLSRIVG